MKEGCEEKAGVLPTHQQHTHTHTHTQHSTAASWSDKALAGVCPKHYAVIRVCLSIRKSTLCFAVEDVVRLVRFAGIDIIPFVTAGLMQYWQKWLRQKLLLLITFQGGKCVLVGKSFG